MTVYHDYEYLKLVERVLDEGVYKPNRTGVGTLSIFGYQMRFNLRDGTIPLLTTKKMHTRSIFHEIIWYLSGDTNIKYLKDNNVTIWDEWADQNGKLGPVYGKQWRSWNTFQHRVHPEAPHLSPTDWSEAWFPDNEIDQIAQVIYLLRNDPNSRRLIVSAWNVGELHEMALPPCHYAFQFYTRPVEDGKYELSLMLNQRSCDVGLGVPFNIAQYATLLHMVAQVVGMKVGEFIWSGGDVHIYENHVDQLREQLSRPPYPSPLLMINPNITDIDEFKFEDLSVAHYLSHLPIKMDVAV